ncbi:MAG TPA: STY0301 family protein [Acetobacteraceae bacterium]|nr:STY0301 family protein [Acetobacteraceae bacterium]
MAVRTMATGLVRPAGAALLLLAAVPHLTHAADIQCPRMHQGSSLTTVSLFDGPPSEHADLEPDVIHKTKRGLWSEWDVAYLFQQGRQLFVECGYGRNIPAVLLQPGPGTGKCEFLSEGTGRVSLTCK